MVLLPVKLMLIACKLMLVLISLHTLRVYRSIVRLHGSRDVDGNVLHFNWKAKIANPSAVILAFSFFFFYPPSQVDFVLSKPVKWKNTRTTAFNLISSGTFNIQMSVATKRLIGLVIEKIMMSSRLIQISLSWLGSNYLWTAVYTSAFCSSDSRPRLLCLHKLSARQTAVVKTE